MNLPARVQRTRGTCPTCGPFALPIPSITLHVNDLTPALSRMEFRCDKGHEITVPIRPDRRDHLALIRRMRFLGARLERTDEASVNDEAFAFRDWLFSDQFDTARARLRLTGDAR